MLNGGLALLDDAPVHGVDPLTFSESDEKNESAPAVVGQPIIGEVFSAASPMTSADLFDMQLEARASLYQECVTEKASEDYKHGITALNTQLTASLMGGAHAFSMAKSGQLTIRPMTQRSMMDEKISSHFEHKMMKLIDQQLAIFTRAKKELAGVVKIRQHERLRFCQRCVARKALHEAEGLDVPFSEDAEWLSPGFHAAYERATRQTKQQAIDQWYGPPSLG